MASDSVTITVPSGPTVSIQTADQTVAGGTDVELEATSRSADGKGLTRAWTDDPAVGTFSNTTVDDVTWMAPATMDATQVVILTLTVFPSDPADATLSGRGSASVTITIPGTNPTVSIQTDGPGPSLEARLSSSKPRPRIPMARSLRTRGPTIPRWGTFSDRAVEDATWTAPDTTTANQEVTLTLTVTDIDGNPASASVVITVPSGPTGQRRDNGPDRPWGHGCQSPSLVSECRRRGRYSPVDRHPQCGDVQ